MKTSRLALVSSVNDYVLYVRSHTLFFLGGVTLTVRDREIFLTMLRFWLFLLKDLMLRLNLSEKSQLDRYANFIGALSCCDLREILVYLDSVALYMCTEAPTIEGFKALQCRALDGTDVSGRLLSPINVAVFDFLTEPNLDKKAYFLEIVLKFLRFPLKLRFEDVDLQTSAIESYLETEAQLSTVELPLDVCDQLGHIIKRWFNSFRIDNLLPLNGPGSVAEGSLTTAQKYHAMEIDNRITVILSNSNGPQEADSYFPIQPGRNLTRRSRTVFVPKTALKLRTISMEPVALQYLQQGVMFELYRFIEEHPYLGVRVKLRDQTQNQIFAWEGSKYGSYATIDLSHASDSVSWALVRRVFKSVPSLYKWLLATRSHETMLPDGTILQLKKFAPMGSALCFPIECILFAAVVEHVLDKKGCTHQLWSVYGDDLILPATCAQDVIDILESLGFTVNCRKTYLTGNYRESCGKEYYAGKDISALYFRIPFYGTRITPSAYGAMCSLANNAFWHNLPTFRDYVITEIIAAKRPGPYFGYSPNRSPELYSPNPTNFHVKSRWSKRYQRFEGKFLTVKSRPRNLQPGDEALAYFIRLVEMARLRRGKVNECGFPPALQGSVEFFSSTVNPIEPFVNPTKVDAWDWDGT